MQKRMILLAMEIQAHYQHCFSMDGMPMPQATIRSTYIILSLTRIPWLTSLISLAADIDS